MRQKLWLGCVLVMLGCGGASEETKRYCVDCDDAGQNNANNQTDAGLDGANNTMAQDQDLITIELPDRCTRGTLFANGLSLFEDKSIEAGLRDINAEGVRISAADINGDGYLDVYARRTGLVGDDFSPEGRRTSWLMLNKGDGTFEDVTESSGIVKSRFTEGARPADVTIWGDVDNDGDMDAFSGFTNDGSVFDAPNILLNQGDGTFTFYDKNMEFQVRAAKTSIGGASFADVNRDGRLDLWIGRGTIDGVAQSDQLYIQQPDGAFVEQGADFGVASQPWTDLAAINQGLAHTNSWGTAACDLNSDGIPELLSASYGRAPNHLWRSLAEGYSNASVTSGYAFDGNQDWSDNHSARCFCQANRGAEGCAQAPDPVFSCASTRGWVHDRDTQAFRLGGNSGTTVCADLNNDGNLDLLTTEIVHFDVGSNADASEILYNDGSGTFTRPGNAATGLTKSRASASWDDGDITAAVLDFDNDGRNDVIIGSTDYPGTRTWMYWQQPDGTFRPLTTVEGISHPSSHGVVVGDFDRDGDQDLIVGHSANRCSSGDHCYPAGERHVRYFENTVGQDGNWLQIQLEGAEGTNRAAIGAQVRVTIGESTQVQEIGGGHGHYGLQDDRVLHFGLGDVCSARVEVRWPDAQGTTQEYELQTRYRYTIKQGELPVAVME